MNEIQNKTRRNEQFYQIFQSFLLYQTNSTEKDEPPFCYAPWLEKDVTKTGTRESANDIRNLLTKKNYTGKNSVT